jgi:hypothetical protein
MNSITNLTPAQLRKAANIQEKIQALQGKLNQILGATVEAAPTAAPKKRKKISAAGRARMKAAQKARWDKIKSKAKPVKKAKKGMSPAAKAKMRELMKARWAKAKKAGKAKL